eukprot:653537-Rhodomonas_salina.7
MMISVSTSVFLPFDFRAQDRLGSSDTHTLLVSHHDPDDHDARRSRIRLPSAKQSRLRSRDRT